MNQNQITINRDGLENGVYFIEVKIGEERVVRKVVVDGR
jgi:LEA14-like dessication related protein